MLLQYYSTEMTDTEMYC